MTNPRQCWQTPPEFFKALDQVFDFDFDAAATKDNRQCSYYAGLDHPMAIYRDGLACRWAKRTFVNPGFEDVGPWLWKAHEKTNGPDGICDVAVVITHVSVATPWWLDAMAHASEVWLPSPRVQFIAPEGVRQTSNPRDTAVWIFRRKPAGLSGGACVRSWRWKEGQ